jgi:hypothetical protein
MRKRTLIFFLVAAMLVAGVATQALAGPKVNVMFKKFPGIDIQGNVKITRLNEGTTETINWRPDSTATFKNIQSGYGPELFRFEWIPDVVPAQVVDVWIDVPTGAAGSTQEHYLPAHNVTFTNTGTYDNTLKIGVFSSRTAGAAPSDSRPGNRNLGVTVATNLHPWNTPATVAMLDGCYTIFAYYGTCPGTTSECHTVTSDNPVCVGGKVVSADPVFDFSF